MGDQGWRRGGKGLLAEKVTRETTKGGIELGGEGKQPEGGDGSQS